MPDSFWLGYESTRHDPALANGLSYLGTGIWVFFWGLAILCLVLGLTALIRPKAIPEFKPGDAPGALLLGAMIGALMVIFY